MVPGREGSFARTPRPLPSWQGEVEAPFFGAPDAARKRVPAADGTRGHASGWQVQSERAWGPEEPRTHRARAAAWAVLKSLPRYLCGNTGRGRRQGSSQRARLLPAATSSASREGPRPKECGLKSS